MQDGMGQVLNLLPPSLRWIVELYPIVSGNCLSAPTGRNTRSKEDPMLKRELAAGLAATVLTAGPALAQTSPAPTQPAGSGQIITQMTPDLMRGSQLMGVDVYGADTQKIGDVDEVLVDKQGRIQTAVVGVGGFLGIGAKDIAIPYDQVQWMADAQTATGATAPAGTNTAGGMTTPTAPGVTPSPGQPATTGSTGTSGTAATTGVGADDGGPDRAMVKMTKADLQNAPAFRYSANDPNQPGAAGNTNPPPASTNRPGNAPQQ
jgi:sporulation protein YlmC with PRC-barrel domain